MSNLHIATLGALLFASLAGPGAQAGEHENIAAVVRACPLSPTNCPRGLVVGDIRIFKGFARASVSTPDGGGETDTAYLRKTPCCWVLLDQGTGVDPEALGVPKEIW